MTNADRIRNMSNEELAKEMVVPFMFMCGYLPNCVFQSNHCGQFNNREDAWKAELEWLESEGKKIETGYMAERGNMDIDLKPCPFCGGEAYFRTPQKNKGSAMCTVSVECKRCGAMPYAILVYEGLLETEKKEAAARAWNNRV